MATFSVRIVDDNQKPVKGVEVTLGFTSFTRGMTSDKYTDSNGFAYFDGYNEGNVKVYVRGSNYGEYSYDDGGSITITI